MNVVRHQRLLVGVICAAAVVGSLLSVAPAASAAPERPVEGELLTDVRTRTLSGTLTLNPLTGATSIVDAQQLTQVVDNLGRALSPMRTSAVQVKSGKKIGKYSCIKKGKAGDGFLAFDRADWFGQSKEGVLQYQFHPYMQADARNVGSFGKSTQYEVCGTGGADLKDGWRIHQTGLGIAFPNTLQTFKIGQQWKEGSTPSDTTTSLGFEVGGGKYPVSINGSISQNPTDKLKGSIVGPYKTDFDTLARNGVNAWWEDSCVQGWSRCRLPADGSPNFQGTVAQGLWEFTPAQASTVTGFSIRPYIRYRCHNPGGC